MASYRFIPPVRALVLYGLGKTSHCPLPLAMRASTMIQEHDAAKARYEASSRVVGAANRGLELWETPHGKFWLPVNQAGLLASLLAEQEHEIYGKVQPGDVVLDCGAHVGTFTRHAVKKGAKLVVAIEPSPLNVEALKRNLAEEIAAGKVIVVAKGVWDKDATLPFHVDPSNSAGDSVVAVAGAGDIQVPLTTIDKVVAELGIPPVTMIKMDIEGAETKALAGAKATIAKHHPRLAICTYHLADDPVNVPVAARAAWVGYRQECGPCGELSDRIIPQTLRFY